jgi:hypothetical protein
VSFDIITMGESPFETIEFPLPNAPSTVETSLKKIVRPADWLKLRKTAFAQTGGVCIVCEGAGAEWSVSGLPVWEFDRTTEDNHGYGTQRLINIIPLCPDCLQLHMVISGFYRYGFDNKMDWAYELYAELCEIDLATSIDRIESQERKVASLEEVAWAIDISKFLRTPGLQDVQIIDTHVVQVIDGVIMGGM